MAEQPPDQTSAPRDEFLYLTTRGRRTGLPREIEIWYLELDESFYLISELRERAQWVQNIMAEPRVRYRIGGRQGAATARLVRPETEPELAARVARAFDERYRWSDGLIVQLRLDAPSQGA